MQAKTGLDLEGWGEEGKWSGPRRRRRGRRNSNQDILYEKRIFSIKGK